MRRKKKASWRNISIAYESWWRQDSENAIDSSEAEPVVHPTWKGPSTELSIANPNFSEIAFSVGYFNKVWSLEFSFQAIDELVCRLLWIDGDFGDLKCNNSWSVLLNSSLKSWCLDLTMQGGQQKLTIVASIVYDATCIWELRKSSAVLSEKINRILYKLAYEPMSFSAINWLLVGRVASSLEKLNSWLRRSACVFSSTLKRLLLPVEEPCGADGRCGGAFGSRLAGGRCSASGYTWGPRISILELKVVKLFKLFFAS